MVTPPKPKTAPAARRQAEREFLRFLLDTGSHLARQAPTDHQRHAALRVTRRLKLLFLN